MPELCSPLVPADEQELRIETFHRATDVVAPGSHRFTIRLNLRRAAHDWITRRAWTDQANRGSAWSDFVANTSPEQLRLFGFQPPGHEHWTAVTLAGVAQRYPGFDPQPWCSAH